MHLMCQQKWIKTNQNKQKFKWSPLRLTWGFSVGQTLCIASAVCWAETLLGLYEQSSKFFFGPFFEGRIKYPITHSLGHVWQHSKEDRRCCEPCSDTAASCVCVCSVQQIPSCKCSSNLGYHKRCNWNVIINQDKLFIWLLSVLTVMKVCLVISFLIGHLIFLLLFTTLLNGNMILNTPTVT